MAVFDQSKADLLADFEESLKELTFPALPVIENLTEIAKENTDIADKILAAIKNRISKSIPDHKLAPLYLFDSIVKKIGPPYNILVGDEVFEIYSNAYLLVNDKTRQRLLNLFETWKNTKLKGSNLPLFPRTQMDKIERFLHQANKSKSGGGDSDVLGSVGAGSGFNTASSTAPSSTHTTPGSTPSLPNKPMLMDHSRSTLTNASLVKDIDTLIPFLQNKLLNNPSDFKLQERINALSKLRTLLVSQTMSVKELQTIQERLRTIMQQEFGSASSTPTTSNATIATNPSKPNQVQSPIPTAAVSSSLVKTNFAEEIFGVLVASGLIKVDQLLILGAQPKYELRFPRIIKTGVVSPLDTNVGSTSKSALEMLLSSARSGPNGPNGGAVAVNSNSINSKNGGVVGFETLKNIELNKLNVDPKNFQKFINSNKPTSVSISLLYDSKPSKCGTCGKRFSDDDIGIKKRRLHLDWHFRVNKRLSSNTSTSGGKGGIIQSRNWYLDGYDWVKFKDENLLEYSTNSADSANAMSSLSLASSSSSASTPTPGSNPNNANSLDGLLLNDGKAPYVVIPTNETNMINKCQICQDQINATYDDDSGEWRWLNCIKAPGEGKNSRKIFHATCFLEANKKRGADGELNTKVKREKI